MSSFRSSSKQSPCPCCLNTGGKCSTRNTSYVMPASSNRTRLDTNMVFCMSLREDTREHKFVGESRCGMWGKYIPHEISAEYNREWAKYLGSNNHQKIQSPQIKRQLEQHQKQRQQEKAAAIIESRSSRQKALLGEIDRDREIQKVLNSLSISDRDYENIKDRGFTHAQILDNQYKTIQPEQPLSEKTSQLLAGVAASGWSLNNKYSGMILPIKNHHGLYIGWQHRPHKTNNNYKTPKYHWAKTEVPQRNYNITSHTKEELELPLAYCQPHSGNINNKTIGLTEGIGFKTQLAADRQEQIVIGASGGLFTSSPQLFAQYLDTASRQLNTKDIVLYADAGAVANPLVLKAYSKAVDFMEKQGYKPKFGWWDQTTKAIGDIDEISDRVLSNIQAISPQSFFQLGKIYSDWHPEDAGKRNTEISKPLEAEEVNDARNFASSLTLSANKNEIEKTIQDYRHQLGDRYDKIKLITWGYLKPKTRNRISDLLSEQIQQQRVEQIAPILASYLKLKQKYKVEDENTFVQYDKQSKVLTYRGKADGDGYLKAKLIEPRKWQNLDSSISQEKTKYFVQEVSPKIEQLQRKSSTRQTLKR